MLEDVYIQIMYLIEFMGIKLSVVIFVNMDLT